jgi:Dehydratase family
METVFELMGISPMGYNNVPAVDPRKEEVADDMTVSGRTIGEAARDARETPGQEVIRPLANPLKATGGMAILRGNLAPDGCVLKSRRTGPDGAPRARAGVRPRKGRVPRRQAWQDQTERRDRDPVRGAEGGPGCGRCWL